MLIRARFNRSLFLTLVWAYYLLFGFGLCLLTRNRAVDTLDPRPQRINYEGLLFLMFFLTVAGELPFRPRF